MNIRILSRITFHNWVTRLKICLSTTDIWGLCSETKSFNIDSENMKELISLEFSCTERCWSCSVVQPDWKVTITGVVSITVPRWYPTNGLRWRFKDRLKVWTMCSSFWLIVNVMLYKISLLAIFFFPDRLWIWSRFDGPVLNNSKHWEVTTQHDKRASVSLLGEIGTMHNAPAVN